MGLDKIKSHFPIGGRGGPADTHSAGDVPETSAPGNDGGGGPGNAARGLRGRGSTRGHGPDPHPRVQDVVNEGKQKLEKLVGQAEQALEGLTRGRGRDGEHVPPGQAKKLQDGGHPEGRDTGQTRTRGGDNGPRTDPPADDGTRTRGPDADATRDARRASDSSPDTRGPDHRGRSHESHGRSDESHGYGRSDRSDHDRRAHGHGRGDDGGDGFNNFRLPSHNSGRGHDFDGPRGRGHLDLRGPGLGANSLNVGSLVAYLRGDAAGATLPRELRQLLDGASRLLGPDLVSALERRGSSFDGDHAVKFIEHALARVARTLSRVAEAGGAAASGVPPRVFDEAVGELFAATLLDKYFRQAEKTGGRVVAQAEAALARLLYGDGRGGGEGGPRRAPGGFELPQRPRTELPAPHPLEVLRDLRAGAFRPPEVSRSPFPLTGRALVATEMMEMMRTLDAVDRVTRELLAAARTAGMGAPDTGTTGLPVFVIGDGDEAPALALLRALAGTTAGAGLLDELLSLLPPSLPGRAASMEIPRLVAALGGVLVDTEGRAFVTKDGVPLKLDQLMWLGSLGGVLKSLAGAESFPTHLSPLLIYGFDAVYSLIGFDGRTLNPPHFAAVQAQVNGSEMEWVFGQPPLSEGWMRALIERLKDSAQADHNLLGEMLEEALADGRFHAALVGGTVSEGAARPDTFVVTRLLPGATADAAFSTA
jgi:hypothetical protein